MNALEALMRSMDDERGSRGADILPEAAIERLKEAAARFHGENPFKVGDIVTPRADACIKGAGKPYLVIGVAPDGFQRGTHEAGQWGTAVKFDTHLLHIDGTDSVVPHVAPSWMLEPYNAN